MGKLKVNMYLYPPLMIWGLIGGQLGSKELG
jgi:hypothetical protein